MRVRAAVTMVILGASGVEAGAGAWPREPGTTFVSLAQRVSSEDMDLRAPLARLGAATSIIAEHGLRDRLTLGLDATRARNIDARETAILVLVRRPVWEGTAGQIAAARVGRGDRRRPRDRPQARHLVDVLRRQATLHT